MAVSKLASSVPPRSTYARIAATVRSDRHAHVGRITHSYRASCSTVSFRSVTTSNATPAPLSASQNPPNAAPKLPGDFFSAPPSP
jgi:hypothetical protein